MKLRLYGLRNAMVVALLAAVPLDARAMSVTQLPANVRDVLSRTIEAYRNAKTYRDSAHVEIRMKADDEANAHVMPVPLTFERPNRVRLNLDVLAVQCDGEKLVRYSRVVNRYTAEEAPEQLSIRELFGDVPAGGIELFVHLYLLTEAEPLSLLLQHAVGVELEADEIIDGRTCKSVRLAMPPARLDGRLLIDGETGLLREFRLFANGKEATMPPGAPAFVSLKFDDAVVNEPLDGEAFAFTPPPEAVKVDDLSKPPAVKVAEAPAGGDNKPVGGEAPGAGGQGENVGIAVGQTAPDFELQTLDGKSIKLSSLRGQVVVLDFWAAWCGPCIRAFPFLERAHKSFANKPVAFVGVCSDRRSPMNRIEAAVRDNGVTFPIAMDREGQVQSTYRVQGLPTTFLIDQEGVIRARHQGFSPYTINQLSQEITKRLGE